MPYIETFYDYDIHRECFRVSDSASYVRTTDTVLKLVSTTTSVINYFTATFSLDVIRNLGDGKVAIYDNNTLLQVITFNENTSQINAISFQFNYNVEHNIEARFMGNDECLPSKSKTIPLLLEIPDSFITNMSFENVPEGNVILNPTSYEQFTLLVTDNNDDPIENALIKIYYNDEFRDTASTNSYGELNISSPQFWDSSIFGIHRFKAVYETTSSQLGAEAEIEIYVGYGATLTPTTTKYIVGQVPSFEVEAKRYDNVPIPNMNVTLWRGD